MRSGSANVIESVCCIVGCILGLGFRCNRECVLYSASVIESVCCILGLGFRCNRVEVCYFVYRVSCGSEGFVLAYGGLGYNGLGVIPRVSLRMRRVCLPVCACVCAYVCRLCAHVCRLCAHVCRRIRVSVRLFI